MEASIQAVSPELICELRMTEGWVAEGAGTAAGSAAGVAPGAAAGATAAAASGAGNCHTLNAHVADCLANVFELVWPDDRSDQFHESNSSPVRCTDSPPNVGPYGAAASTRRARKRHSSLINQLQPEPACFLGSLALSWCGDFLHCSIV